MDTLIPLLYVAHQGNAQAAVDNAAGLLRDAVARFNVAANALLEDNAGDKVAEADLVSFIDSCRYACTANLNWRWVTATFALERCTEVMSNTLADNWFRFLSSAQDVMVLMLRAYTMASRSQSDSRYPS